MESGEPADGLRELRLPFWITATRQARQAGALGCLFLIGVVAAVFGGALFAVLKSALIAGPAAAITAALLIVYWRRSERTANAGLPSDTVEISARQIRCNAYESEASEWERLTPFRWVLGCDPRKKQPFRRGDSAHDVPAEQTGEFLIEAAWLEDQSQDNEFGYYNRAAIQFDFPGMVIGPATRSRADWLVAWLNGMQAKAKAGGLESAECAALPSWLNAMPVGATAAKNRAPVPAVDRKSR
jgi:hypothetical protein